MRNAGAAVSDIRSFDDRGFPLSELGGAALLLGRTAVVGLGGIVAVGAMVTTVTVTAAWIVTTVVSSNPNHLAMTPTRLAAIDVANLSPSSTRVAHVNNVGFEAKWALAMALTSTPHGLEAGASSPDLDRVAEASPALPQSQIPPADAMPDIARASAAIEVAELPPLAAAVAPPAPVPLPAAKPEPEQANSTPLPRPYPLKREVARSRAEEAPAAVTKPAGPQIAMLPPPAPPQAEKRGTQERSHERSNGLPDVDSRTAVYDISAQTVYLPNGEKLEAHSGLGEKMDDPRYVRVKNRGPTPPNVYNLKLREALFHGVQAVRLNPVDESAMFGRDGILAHTYMLGPNGQSNGCVSFRDYPRFLRAVVRGDVNRMVVVANLGDKPWRHASWRTAAARDADDPVGRFWENIIP